MVVAVVGRGRWCGHAFGFPDRHFPWLFAGAGPSSCGVVVRSFGRVVGSCVRWWFENWIVDASK
ncbi:hypothetical protein CPA40_11160 [Bifidobacterium callitrichos]|uniref:Uncharacterized protein n=1 Tax=Bifidobacterium callitrichos TaxID=762209 RepID=A0A2T3G7E7_9BIFI|nr:hypothetical protein CPA40_11160 [Bifidobacterium callitrichos]